MEEFKDVKSVLSSGVKLYVAELSRSLTDVYHSSIVLTTDNEVAFTIPLKDGYYYPFSVGTELEIYFYSGSGRYYFSTTIIGRVLYRGAPVIKCDLPSVLIRTERRQYYRMDVEFPIVLTLKRVSTNAEVSFTEYRGKCVNISGGGIQLCTTNNKLPIDLNDEIDIDFCEALSGLSKATGVVMREPTFTEAESSGWGIKFSSINDSDRDKIIRYVFKQQLEFEGGYVNSDSKL